MDDYEVKEATDFDHAEEGDNAKEVSPILDVDCDEDNVGTDDAKKDDLNNLDIDEQQSKGEDSNENEDDDNVDNMDDYEVKEATDFDHAEEGDNAKEVSPVLDVDCDEDNVGTNEEQGLGYESARGDDGTPQNIVAAEKDEENKIEDEGDMSQETQEVLPTIDEETPFHKGDAMSTQEVVEHESDFVAQKSSNDMNKGSVNMLPTIEETQIHEGNTKNSEEKMVVVENKSDVQTSPKPSDDMIIKDTYNMPLRDEEVEGSEKKDEANEEHQGALATTEVQDKVDKGIGKVTRNANKAQSIQGRVQGTEGGKKNQVADALSRRPRANAVSIAYNHNLTSMIGKYAKDSDYQGIMQGLAQGQVIEPYSLKEEFLLYENWLRVTKDMRGKVMSESHEPPYAGHRGIQPTTKAIELYFYWPHMRQDIEDYVSKCIVCQKVKYERGKPSGLLQPLPIPDAPWQSISMDFIFGLPISIQGNNGIWTIVDRFSKQAHFLSVKKTIKAKNMATMFISQIFKYHGMPSSIASDQDPRMTSLFWQGMFENLGTKLNFSSAYHPQTNDQSEIANSIVLDLLKGYVGEVIQANQWEKYLPHVEYAYNNTIHTSMGKTPFEVIEGRPRLPLILKPHEKIFAADEEVRDIPVAFDKIKESIQSAQQTYKSSDTNVKALQN
ncbi:hypothetical protein L7F22_015709 [Adiantum nelumboides]|nr:hypothetical protein [Adiantum nelumboides]